MLLEPTPDTEYLLCRFFDGAWHIVSFTRFSDDSGSITHGHWYIGWEFNPNEWATNWSNLRSAGWILLEEALATLLVDRNAILDCRECDCSIPETDRMMDRLLALGMSIPEINRECREYVRPFYERQSKLLWG